MNRMCSMLVLLLLSLTSAEVASAQQSYILGLPARLDQETGAAVQTGTMKLLLECASGSRIQVFDAQTLQKVADFVVPNSTNQKKRLVELKTEVAALKSHFARITSVRDGKAGATLVPQFLELAASTLKRSTGSTTILLFTAPYYQVVDSPFTFGDGYFPSDGHVLASSKVSVFGTSDKSELLAGTVVHICYLTEGFDNELERVAVRRFWKIYLDGLGSVLSSFEASSAIVLERAAAGMHDPVILDRIDLNDRAVEMRRIQFQPVERSDREPPQAPPAPSVPAPPTPQVGGSPPREQSEPSPTQASGGTTLQVQVPTPLQQNLQKALTNLPQPKPGEIILGGAWLTERHAEVADVDLYVRANPTAPELHFRNVATPQGDYLRDIRAASSSLVADDWSAQWEAVVLRNASLEDVTLWLDLYRGVESPIYGIIRLSLEDRVIDQAFSFPASAGDRAAGTSSRTRNACWIEVDLVQMYLDDARTRALGGREN